MSDLDCLVQYVGHFQWGGSRIVTRVSAVCTVICRPDALRHGASLTAISRIDDYAFMYSSVPLHIKHPFQNLFFFLFTFHFLIILRAESVGRGIDEDSNF